MELSPENLLTFVIWFIVFVFSTTVHEFGHSWTAYLGGDRTAYEGGQVSLDPMPHIRRSPFGMVLIPIVSFWMWGFLIGFASAPIDSRWAQRNPKWYAVMSAAGPIGNFVLAIIAFVAMLIFVKTGVLDLAPSLLSGQGLSLSHIVVAPGEASQGPYGALAMMLSAMLALNVILGVFNLMPAPPLDGAAVLEGLFPQALGPIFQKMRAQPFLQLFSLYIAWNVFGLIGFPILGAVISLLV